MSLSDFFSPVNVTDFTPKNGFYSCQLGAVIHSYKTDFPELESNKFTLAIFGVKDDRGTINNQGCGLGADYVRSKLYSLNESNVKTSIVDLGNILPGHQLSDTYIAVKTVVAELIKLNIVPIILGGSHDITYAQYLAYETLEQNVDLVVIDSYFDMDENQNQNLETNSVAYLNKIFLHEPNYLFNFSNIGYQTYFVSQDSLRTMDKLFFDAQRLGEVSGMVHLAEPTIRNANMLSFDINSVKAADAMGNANANPNGFYAHEACQLCKYAGYNDKLTSIGFYEFNPAYDTNGQTAMLLAQMIWCFIDGFYSRKNDIPLLHKSDYVTYKTSLKTDVHELIFVKSKKTNRWWMQVPYPHTVSKNERFHLVPCHYNDYQLALKGEMPNLWWRTYQKLN
ncbi:MAG: arginase [Sphingobacteriales bacterium]|nr:MAG: arginase [Sphingobacteriales bacterium]TAF82087.1 MAG: arginase [Sphingobacteriales bacterium]